MSAFGTANSARSLQKSAATVSIIILLAFCFIQCTDAKSIAEWKYRTIYQLLTDRYAKPSSAQNSTKNFDCDLHDYCGGNYRGMIQKLDYIKDMGFNAVR